MPYLHENLCSLLFFVFTTTLCSLNAIYPPTFHGQHAPQTYITPGENLILHCQANASPTPRFTWFLTGRPMSTMQEPIDDHGSTSRQSPLPINYIPDWQIMTLPARAMHWCTATNQLGTAVSNPTEFIRTKNPTIASISIHNRLLPYLMWFKVLCLTDSGIPPVRVHWTMEYPNGTKRPIIDEQTMPTDDLGNLFVINIGILPRSVPLSFDCVLNSSTYHQSPTWFHRTLTLEPSTTFKKSQLYLLYRSAPGVSLAEGELLSLKCIYVDDPFPVIRWEWRKDARENFEDIKVLENVAVKQGGSELYVNNVTYAHKGIYRCKCSINLESGNIVEGETVEFDVEIRILPRFSVKPKPTVIKLHETGYLFCSSNESHSSGNSLITWLLNGEFLNYNYQKSYSLMPNRSLQLQNLPEGFTGVFQCKLTNINGWQIANAYVEVYGRTPKFVRKMYEYMKVAETHESEIACEVTGEPEPMVTWLKNNAPISATMNRYFREQSTLKFKKTDLEDAGLYTCEATNPFGTVKANILFEVIQMPYLNDDGMVLLIQALPKLWIPVPNLWKDSTPLAYILRNRPMKLQCLIRGKSSTANLIDMKWLRNGQYIDSLGEIISNKPSSLESVEEIVILDIKAQHLGKYECQATTMKNKLRAELEVRSLDETEITRFTAKLAEGDPVSVMCCLSSHKMVDINRITMKQNTTELGSANAHLRYQCTYQFNLTIQASDDMHWVEQTIPCDMPCLRLYNLKDNTRYTLQVSMKLPPIDQLKSDPVIITTGIRQYYSNTKILAITGGTLGGITVIAVGTFLLVRALIKHRAVRQPNELTQNVIDGTPVNPNNVVSFFEPYYQLYREEEAIRRAYERQKG